jgi:hypothetical protein
MSYRPVSPNKTLPAFSPHSSGMSIWINRLFGDFPQIIVKGQKESSRGSLRYPGELINLSVNTQPAAGDGP